MKMMLIVIFLCLASFLFGKEDGHLAENELPDYSLRDPFWPVGYMRKEPKKISVEEAKKKELQKLAQWPKLKTRGFIKTAKGDMAMIDGVNNWVKEGQVIVIVNGDIAYYWKVKKISKKERTLIAKRIAVKRVVHHR